MYTKTHIAPTARKGSTLIRATSQSGIWCFIFCSSLSVPAIPSSAAVWHDLPEICRPWSAYLSVRQPLGRHQVRSQRPLVQGDLGPLNDSPGRDRDIPACVWPPIFLGAPELQRGTDDLCGSAVVPHMGCGSGPDGEDGICRVSADFRRQSASHA